MSLKCTGILKMLLIIKLGGHKPTADLRLEIIVDMKILNFKKISSS